VIVLLYFYAGLSAVGAAVGIFDAGAALIVGGLVICTDFITHQMKRGAA
jgi:hypothetical protein